MRTVCEGCKYRVQKRDGVDCCTYILENGEPRGCEPEECRALGRYETGKKKRKGMLEW